MRYLILLQAALAILYFITGPFQMNWSLWITLTINLLALAYLWKHHHTSCEESTPGARSARLIFIITLILLELLIEYTTTQFSQDVLSDLINDSETFITGVLIGLLWRNELLNLKWNPQKNKML